MSKKADLWKKVGLYLRELFRRQWPLLYVSCTEHNRLQAEVIRLQSDNAHLLLRLQSETAIGFSRQSQFHRDYAVMNQTIEDQACGIAQEMTASLGKRIIELTTERDQLRQLAEYDPLTKLCNRRGLDERFRVAYSALAHSITQDTKEKRRQPTVSALMIDIDHFKMINDRYGHPIGDQVLEEVARIIRTHFQDKRPSDILCRWGGEEFLVVLPQSDARFAYAEALQLANTLRTTTVLHGEVVTASIGVAEIRLANPRLETPDGLLSRLYKMADRVLYRAKQPDPEGWGNHPGRDRVVRYDPTRDEVAG